MTTNISPPDKLPTKAGVYRTRVIDPESNEPTGNWGYSYFDLTDRIWGCLSSDPAAAHSNPDFEFAEQNKEWCKPDEEPAT
jgi:hypothetical protein